MAKDVTKRLKELNIRLPNPANPAGNYVPYTIAAGLVFVSGQIPLLDGKLKYIGKLGKDISIEEGQDAARLCGLNILAQLKNACEDDLNRVKKVLKINGFVNGTSEFHEQPLIINSASDLMFEVFAESGKHARAAIGCASLPLGASVEVEGIFEIEV